MICLGNKRRRGVMATHLLAMEKSAGSSPVACSIKDLGDFVQNCFKHTHMAVFPLSPQKFLKEFKTKNS